MKFNPNVIVPAVIWVLWSFLSGLLKNVGHCSFLALDNLIEVGKVDPLVVQ